jgi:hypothetical protein
VAAGDHPVRHPQIGAEGLDLQDVTGPRLLHEDGSGDHVGAVPVEVALGAVVVAGDLDRVVEDPGPGNALPREELHGVPALVLEDPLVGDGVDGDRPPGAHAQRGLRVHGRDVAPQDAVHLGGQVVVAGDGAASGLEDRAVETGSAALQGVLRAGGGHSGRGPEEGAPPEPPLEFVGGSSCEVLTHGSLPRSDGRSWNDYDPRETVLPVRRPRVSAP